MLKRQAFFIYLKLLFGCQRFVFIEDRHCTCGTVMGSHTGEFIHIPDVRIKALQKVFQAKYALGDITLLLQNRATDETDV